MKFKLFNKQKKQYVNFDEDGLPAITADGDIIFIGDQDEYSLAERDDYKIEIEPEYEIGKYYPSMGVFAGELKKEDGFYGIFVAMQNASEKDENKGLQEFTWNEAMELKFSQDNMHVPDIRELSLIQLNIDDVNAGLKTAGGDELKGWYWSSTENVNGYAWRVDLSSGSRDNGNKDNYRYVRPVLALKL